MFGFKIRPDLKHGAILVVSVFGGAALAVIQHDGIPVTLAQAWPEIVASAYAGLIAVIAMARKSFLVAAAGAGGGGTASAPAAALPPIPFPAMPMVIPGPAISKMISLSAGRRARSVAMRAAMIVFCFAVMVTGTVGCTAAWWQAFQADPVAQVTSFVQYVESFVQTATTIWSAISPLLGANTPQATSDFNAAVATLQNALAVAQDAAQAAVKAQAKTIDVAAIFAPVQDAATRVLAVINQWQTTSGASTALAAAPDTLTRQAQAIATWRHY